jgi:hypothetical protein
MVVNAHANSLNMSVAQHQQVYESQMDTLGGSCVG